jgi:hypothetical protein
MLVFQLVSRAVSPQLDSLTSPKVINQLSKIPGIDRETAKRLAASLDIVKVTPDFAKKLEQLYKMAEVSPEIKLKAALQLVKPTISVAVAVALETKIADPNAKFEVSIDGKTQLKTIDEIANMAVASLVNDLSTKSPLAVLAYGFPEANDNTSLIDILKSKLPWINNNSLEILESGGTNAFKADIISLKDPSFVKSLVEAALRSVNSDNHGSALNPLGIQEANVDVSATVVLAALALSSVGAQKIGTKAAITAFGTLKKVTLNVESDGNQQGHMCSEVKDSVYAGLCLRSDLNYQAYTGGDIKNVINEKGADYEKRAAALFGQDFVDNVNGMIEAAVSQFLSTKGAGSRETLSSFITDQLQTIGTINDMKGTSEFAHNAATEEQKKRDGWNGFMGPA